MAGQIAPQRVPYDDIRQPSVGVPSLLFPLSTYRSVQSAGRSLRARRSLRVSASLSLCMFMRIQSRNRIEKQQNRLTFSLFNWSSLFSPVVFLFRCSPLSYSFDFENGGGWYGRKGRGWCS